MMLASESSVLRLTRVSTGSVTLPDRYFDQSMASSSGLGLASSVVTSPESSLLR
ncbi:hypothetical protein D9M69_720930 [compost metagenome]